MFRHVAGALIEVTNNYMAILLHYLSIFNGAKVRYGAGQNLANSVKASIFWVATSAAVPAKG